MPTFGSLFAGIGGMDLGLERAGWECSWQVEIDDYANRVLEKHWPNVRRCKDVREFPPTPDGWEVDLIAGGFPCQGISACNYRGKGLEDERSGLWREFARAIGVLRPRFALLENVPALTFRGLGTVLRDLAEIGYDAEWDTLSAWQFGAPHQRERIFIVAYPTGKRCEEGQIFPTGPSEAPGSPNEARLRNWPGRIESDCALPNRVRWVPHNDLCRVVDGIPAVLDPYRVLGNAIVPQVAEFIGKRLLKIIQSESANLRP